MANHLIFFEITISVPGSTAYALPSIIAHLAKSGLHLITPMITFTR
jgi:hypothetical protein